VVFGSGYVLLAFLQADLVDRLHWVTKTQLLDAITAGQVTPGPLFATATFLGYLVHGCSGALAATVAIFMPSFFMAALVAAMAGRLRQSPVLAGFLDGVNAAAVALMAAVTLTLGRAALTDAWTWAIAAMSALLLLRFKLNATWLILAGAALGVLLHAFPQ
jgi:chromate transporter